MVYYPEHTKSFPILEAKQGQTWLVLEWEEQNGLNLDGRGSGKDLVEGGKTAISIFNKIKTSSNLFLSYLPIKYFYFYLLLFFIIYYYFQVINNHFHEQV